ncbi:hypothetical protein L2E82_17035 [Cichorium intybus]|uniref:Uncharacterized protein n=1 Tax=Cichorium intybus TaxID=13427 RepID=A0ACB9F771_CICIN|nr:hypothetical protein L2E82_17035 [Cichorium intybus]
MSRPCTPSRRSMKSAKQVKSTIPIGPFRPRDRDQGGPRDLKANATWTRPGREGWAGDMARRREQRQQQVERNNIASHEWLQFPNTLPAARLNVYTANIERYRQRDVEPALVLDWNFANTLGITAALDQYLVKSDGTYTSYAWRNLFQIREHSYKELMLEFFSTVTFDPTEEDMFVRTGLSFRLGGEPRQCSVVELGWRLGLYPHGETRSPEFRAYLAHCITSPPEELVNEEFWGRIASTLYLPETAIESAIRSPIHRLLHRLVATSVNQRRGSEKVPAADLFYLWCLLTPGRHCNLPYSLAFFLARKATGARGSSPLCGGHLITRLAHSYGVTTLPAMRSMTPREPRAIGRQYLESMHVIRPAGPPGVFVLAEPDQDEQAPDAAQAPPPPPRRRQRQRQRSPIPPQDPEPEINLGTIYQQMQSWRLESQTQYRQMQDWHLTHQEWHLANQVQQQWMADSMTDFFHQQGFQPQHPYPSIVPPVPDWYTGSHSTGDGAGPSGTHFDDEEDE